jgi:hypothetical protein
LDQILAWAAAVCPEVKAGDLAAERASLAVELARKEFKPDFAVQAGYMNRGGLDAMWQAGVSVSVPLYRKRLAAGLAEMEARVRAARSSSDSIRLQLRFRTQERFTQLRLTERTATLYRDGIVPQDRMSLEAALANYQTGKVPFIAVLEALMTLYNDSATRLRFVASHEATLASLEEASLEQTSSMPSGLGGGMAGDPSSVGMGVGGPGAAAMNTSEPGGMR